MVDLVEREDVMATLNEDLTSAGTVGHFVFLAGAAGTGKTSVVRELASAHPKAALIGACDALSTPRTLGPLFDMATQSPEIERIIGLGSRHAMFTQLLTEMRRRRLLMIFEDVHWADDATLDLLVFIGRRITNTKSLVVATFRSDEIGPSHPTRRLLGSLTSSDRIRRLTIEPLSVDGVEQLAKGHPVDAAHLHSVTGGNAFNVTEVLAAPGWTVPPTVADAVLARANRLPEATRPVLNAVAVEPTRIEREVLARLGHSSTDVDAAVEAGMLVDENARIGFRHELARLAILDSVSPGERLAIHTEIYKLLAAQTTIPAARLAHHAKNANNDAGVLEWSVAAADAAVDAGAHRQAVEHYGDAATAAETLGDDRLIALLDLYATELSAVDRRHDALAIRNRINALVTVPEQVLEARANYAYALWVCGRGDEARSEISTVTDDARHLPGSFEIASVFAEASYIAMLSRQGSRTVELAGLAIEMARRYGNLAGEIRALNALGSARIGCSLDLEGVADLEQSATLAASIGADRPEADAFNNLGTALGEIRSYDLARGYLDKSVAFCAARDLDGGYNYSLAWLARVEFETGNWDRALDLIAGLPDNPAISPITPIVAETVVALIKARRDDPEAERSISVAWELAAATSDLQRTWPVIAARSELLSLGFDTGHNLESDLLATLSEARTMGVTWAIGELGYWALALGFRSEVPSDGAEPFRLQAEGQLQAAADAWSAIGAPYEQARALADTDDASALSRALTILDGLRAERLARRVRQQLRGLGVRGIKRGPRRSTADHPGGLTPRQSEVLDLVRSGYTDREIADRLFISPKTVGHHVSAILTKLGVTNRNEAAARATALGWDHTPETNAE